MKPGSTCGGRKAFTLIELLVVIAILAVLVTLLLPFLSRARELTRRAVDMSNFRNVTSATNAFAAMHEGRAPGNALVTINNYSSVAWTDILNAEYYRADNLLRGIWRWPLPKNQIICPNARLYTPPGGQTRWYTCLMQMNSDLAGGACAGYDPNLKDTMITYSQYGKYVNPSKVQYMYNENWGTTVYGLGFYYLGARVEAFKRPDFTYAFIESEHANSTIGSSWPWNPSYATLSAGKDASYPPWGAGIGGPGDFYGFRHTLPPDLQSYQQQATAVFGFVDGHVTYMSANENLNNKERFFIQPEIH